MPRHSQPAGRKIATCCYCGNRAVLVFDRHRHELACATCGAPLHDLKSLPQLTESKSKKRSVPVTERRLPRYPREMPPHRRTIRGRPAKKRRKPVLRRLLAELWDEIEDIFD